MDAKNPQRWPTVGLSLDVEALTATPRSLQVLGKIYRTTTARVELDGRECHLIDVASYNHDIKTDGDHPTIVDINWNITAANFHESPILHHGDMYRFRALANSPIMVVWRNRHRWDASEHIVATREELVQFLCAEKFESPWLIFNQTRLFPATPRIPDSAISGCTELGARVSDVLCRLLGGDEASNVPIIENLDVLKNDLIQAGKTHRYLEVNVPRSIFHRSTIHRVARFINNVFFEAGVVLLRKCDRPATQESAGYQGRQGETYHDLKLQVDRLATYSGGGFDTGWADWLTAQQYKREQQWHGRGIPLHNGQAL